MQCPGQGGVGDYLFEGDCVAELIDVVRDVWKEVRVLEEVV